MDNLRKSACGAEVVVERLAKGFEGHGVLHDVSLRIAPGEFVAVVGRSGSGKSTLLRVLCGLEEPTSGSSRVVGPTGADARGEVRVVFQEPRLLPWKSVLDNVCIGVSSKDSARRERGRNVLDSVGLGDRADGYPGVLSGGQRQRVALARALIHEPCVMLLDEPFGALDALTRIEAQRLVESLWLERGFTAFLVTHDVHEAVLLSDRVVLIEDGVIAETFVVDAPRPRRRESSEVAAIAAEVLDRIFASPDAGRRRASISGIGQVQRPLPRVAGARI